MINIPFVTTLFILLVSVNSFRVLPRDDDPELVINEDQNLIEPKVNFWNVFLKTKAKTSFKNVLKYLNSIDSRDKYTVVENEAAVVEGLNQPPIIRSEFREIKEFGNIKKETVKKVDDSLIIQDVGKKEMETDTGLVSGGDFDRVYFDSASNDESTDGSESLDSPRHRVVGSISRNSGAEESIIASVHNVTDSKTDKSESKESAETSAHKVTVPDNSDSKDSSDSSAHKVPVARTDSSDSKESVSTEESEDGDKQEGTVTGEIKYREALRYEPRLPMSLHHYSMSNNRRRFTHSFRDGWVF